METASKPADKKNGAKKEKEVDPEVLPFLEFLEPYLNFNRI